MDYCYFIGTFLIKEYSVLSPPEFKIFKPRHGLVTYLYDHLNNPCLSFHPKYEKNEDDYRRDSEMSIVSANGTMTMCIYVDKKIKLVRRNTYLFEVDTNGVIGPEPFYVCSHYLDLWEKSGFLTRLSDSDAIGTDFGILD